MFKEKIKKQKGMGYIRFIIYAFIAILILSYFGFSLKDLMHKDVTQENLHYIGDFLFNLWEKYLKPIYDFLANFFGPYISQTLDNLQNNQDFVNPNVPDLVPGLK